MEIVYMKEAIELAKKGLGKVNPNPLVGAVIVKESEIIGRGYHEKFGGAHAEVNAINEAEQHNISVEDATIYITLEPCFHYGKTPPCVDLIIEKKIGKVVIGMKDPNPLVAGKSIKKLKEQGIEVVLGVLENEIREMNRFFIKSMTEKKPYVTMKAAMTLDGKIATHTGDSRGISGDASIQFAHQMRQDMMGIMVGIGTVLKDDPKLTTRLTYSDGDSPRPIIVDSKGRLPLDAKVIKEHKKGQVILATTNQMDLIKMQTLEEMDVEVMVIPDLEGRVNLEILMSKLSERGIDSVLLEGGSELNASAIKFNIVDEIAIFVAPKIIGGGSAKTPIGGEGVRTIGEALPLDIVEVKMLSSDVFIRTKVRK